MKEITEPLLSVIVPIYNVEKYLSRCLDSIINQTYRNLEIICVDDGSTDKSSEIADEYSRIDKRIRVIHKENRGLVSARKTGINQAKGMYATYVDSDDYIEKVMFEKLMKYMIKNGVDVVTSGVIREYAGAVVCERENCAPGIYRGEEYKINILNKLIDINSFFRRGILPTVWNKIVKIDLLRSVQMCVDDRVIVCEDDCVVYPLLFRCNSIAVSGEVYYHYCIRETGSILGTKTSDDIARLEIVFQYLEAEFITASKRGIDLISQYNIWKLSVLMLRDASKVLNYDGKVLYPFGKVKKKARIVLYGAGKFGIEMKEYLDKENFQIVAWIDKSSSRPEVVKPENLVDIDYDVIIIAVINADVAHHIRSNIKKLGVSERQMRYVDISLIKKHLIKSAYLE